MKIQFCVCREFAHQQDGLDDPMCHLRLGFYHSREEAIENYNRFREADPNAEYKIFMMVTDQVA